MDNSARQIRQRIIWIILCAFVAVFFVTLLMVILATGAAIAKNSTIPPFRELPILYQLEGYFTEAGRECRLWVEMTRGLERKLP